MIKITSSILLLMFLGVMLNSCEHIYRKKPEEQALARVHNKYLFPSDLDGIIEPGTSAQDSIVTAERYIDSWIRQQVILHEAKNNLSPDQMNFDKKIEDYLNSLIIYSFETDYIKNNLDTVVIDEQITEYYEEYKNDFRLKENIVMASFIKISIDAPDQNIVRKLYRSEDPDDRVQLEEYCLQNAAAYFLDMKSWMIFNDLLRNIPLEASNQEYFLRNNRAIEITDEFYRYFLYIYDYKLKESVSPLAFEEKNIKNIIINKRKHNLISGFRNQLYRNAVKDNSFDIFKE